MIASQRPRIAVVIPTLNEKAPIAAVVRAVPRDSVDEVIWNLEMQMRAARAGLRILELPIAHRRRAGGASRVAGTIVGTLKASLRIGLIFVRAALERQHRPQSTPYRDARG